MPLTEQTRSAVRNLEADEKKTDEFWKGLGEELARMNEMLRAARLTPLEFSTYPEQ